MSEGMKDAPNKETRAHDAELKRLHDIANAQAERIRELESEAYYLTNAGTIECMVRNKAVAEYIGNAEKRITELEAKLAAAQRLRESVAICLSIESPAMLREALAAFDKETGK